MSCFFAQYDSVVACDGRIDPCHLVPQQRLKRAGYGEDVIWDERIVVPGCRRHHSRYDNLFFNLTFGQYPAGVHEFVTEHGLLWQGPRRRFRVPDRTAQAIHDAPQTPQEAA